MSALNGLIQFVYDNLTPLLGAITVISFCLNIVQYKTKKIVQHVFSSIYHTANRAYHENNENKKSNQELASLIISIRHQSVAGLRSSGVQWYYEDSGMPGSQGIIYRILNAIYRILLAIRIKVPLLIKGSDPRVRRTLTDERQGK